MSDVVLAGMYSMSSAGLTGPVNAGLAGDIASSACEITGSSSAMMLAMALRGVQAGVRDLNLYGPFAFGTEQQSDTNLVAAQAGYGLPVNFFMLRAAQLIDTAGKVEQTLEYMPWDQFNLLVGRQDAVGRPQVWTTKSAFYDKTISVYPVPGADEATALDLRLVTVHRVPPVTAPDTVILGPEDVYQVLVYWTQYYLAERRMQDNQPLIDRLFAQYRDARAKLRSNDRPDAAGMFQIRVAGR